MLPGRCIALVPSIRHLDTWHYKGSGHEVHWVERAASDFDSADCVGSVLYNLAMMDLGLIPFPLGTCSCGSAVLGLAWLIYGAPSWI